MTSIAASLSKILPAPKHAPSEDAEPSGKPTARILGGGEESQLILKKTGPPPYGKRSGWRPRNADDFGDGGAFPEIPVAQYPYDMGRKGGSSTSKSLALQVDATGAVKYDAIARQGHDSSRIVHAQFKDLIPLRQRADVGEISLERPSEEEVAAQTEKTRLALATLVSGAVAAQRPKLIKGTNRKEPTYVRYTPSDHMGNAGKKNERIIKIVERQEDPMEPPKFKHKKIPRGPPSPPAPVMHSPPRKLTAADQEAWTIPPPISNWKNPKGYTVPLDKRLAADGRGLQDVTINDKFAQFAEALFTADRHAREEVRQRAMMQQKLAEKEKAQKEEHLRMLAQKAREAHSGKGRGRARSMSTDRSRSQSRSRSRSRSSSIASSAGDSENDEAAREREKIRRERNKEAERQLRMGKMGSERRLQQMAKEQNRDIGEKIALGLAKPTTSAESMYDSRLFSQTSGFNTGFNEDQVYDKPLFSAAEAASHIYRPRTNAEDEGDDEAAAASELDRFKREKRFDVLGKAAQGFKGAADVEQRDGPVQFEKATTGDIYGIDQFLQEVEAGSKGKKKHGLDIPESSSAAASRGKRARVDDDDDED
ncbi:SKIP/SNW domain-containing protein [Peziza echinospora]|nr:SKIP/SNW domain-containing protein [Peziza echinospora]